MIEKKKIRVLEVIRQGQIGGGESHVLDLIDCLDKSLITPIAMAFTGGHMIDTLEAQGIKCYVVETQRAFDRRAMREVRKIVEQEQIDIIHAHGSRAASNMVFVARKLHIPLIYTVHGWSFHQDQPWHVRKLRAWSEKLICHYASRIICVSESNRATGEEMFGLSNCDVIENGINLHRFDSEGQYADLRQELGFTPDDFVVAEVCRITLQKAPLDFLKAVELAHAKDARIKGLLVGEGDMEEDARQYIASHNMADYLRTSSFRTDVPAVLHAIDVYALPSLWEGLSIALLEALAMKKPVVVTPTDGTKELIEDGVNGTIIPFSQPEAQAEAFLRYLSNADMMKQHGQAAFAMVKERFNAQRVADTVTKLYRKVSLCIKH